MPIIDSFKSGSIVISGKTYTRDVLILPDGTVKQRKSGFWKFGSHIVNKSEIDELLTANPQVVVVGTGTGAKAELGVGLDVESRVAGARVELIALPSEEAVQRLNRLVDAGKRVAALIHITR